jgi:hypothetical protein
MRSSSATALISRASVLAGGRGPRGGQGCPSQPSHPVASRTEHHACKAKQSQGSPSLGGSFGCRLFGLFRRGHYRHAAARGKSGLRCCAMQTLRRAGLHAGLAALPPELPADAARSGPHSRKIDELAKRSAEMKLESDQMRSNAARLKSAVEPKQARMPCVARPTLRCCGAASFAEL